MNTRLLLCAWFCFLGALCHAHDLTLTAVELVNRTSGTEVKVVTPVSRLLRESHLVATPSEADIDLAIRSRLVLLENNKRVQPDSSSIQVDSGTDMVTWRATLSGRGAIGAPFYPDDPRAETLVTTKEAGKPDQELLVQRTSFEPLVMVGTGFEHIWCGADHILFVCGLVTIGGCWRSLLKLVSTFTVAHCCTLAAASFGLVRVNPRVVEPLIALSIVVLAVEALRSSSKTKPKQAALAVAFAFGLVHGLGFAGGLTSVGLAGPQLALNLAAFSGGVELGQLSILSIALGLAALAARRGPSFSQRYATVSSVLIGMTGCFWLVERLF